jgi:hypothetical protein
LISFKRLKPQTGQKKSLETMLDLYGLANVQNINVKIKVCGEACIAGFFVKKCFVEQELMEPTNYSINDVHPEWSGVYPFWTRRLHIQVEQHLDTAKGQHKYRKHNRIDFVGLDKTDQEGYEGEDEAYIYEIDMDDDEDDSVF